MIFQNIIAFFHHFPKNFILRKEIFNHKIEFIGFGFQFLPDSLQKYRRILRRNFIGAVVDNGPLFIRNSLFFGKGYNIAAQGNVCLLHIHADTERFQRRTSGIVESRIIAKHGQIGCITARAHTLRYCMGHADFRLFSQCIHSFRFSIFQRCFSAQRFQRLISHAIA